MTTNFPLRIKLFGIGLEAFWEQFSGLKEQLEGYISIVNEKIAQHGVEVANLGLVDTLGKAIDVGHRFKREDLDLIQAGF